MSIAPFHVVIVPVSNKDEQQMEIAEELYQQLLAKGIEVILDDRDGRAGVKFADADLIGYPLRITVGKKSVNEGTVDIKIRRDGTEMAVKLDEVTAHIQSLIEKEMCNL